MRWRMTERRLVFIPTLNAGNAFRMVRSEHIHFDPVPINEVTTRTSVPAADVAAVPGRHPTPVRRPPFQSILEAWDPQKGSLCKANPAFLGRWCLGYAADCFSELRTAVLLATAPPQGTKSCVWTGSVIMSAPVSYQLDGVNILLYWLGRRGWVWPVIRPGRGFQVSNIERLIVLNSCTPHHTPPPRQLRPCSASSSISTIRRDLKGAKTPRAIALRAMAFERSEQLSDLWNLHPSSTPPFKK